MSRPSIERVLAKAGPDRYSPPSDEERADALAAAVEDGPLIDRDRGIVVMKADPDLVPVMLSREEVEIMSRTYSGTTIGAACDAALEANPRGES